jgi:peptidoglycan-N-acetylglucosamine deacetylase
MRSERDPRWAERPQDAEPIRLTRRGMLAVGGGVLLISTVAAIASKPGPSHPSASGPPGTEGGHPGVPPARQHPKTKSAAHADRHGKAKPVPDEPVYYIDDGPKTIALTIDDGPSPVYTPQILQLLSEYQVTASFSMIGRNAAAYPGVAREVAAAGHMIVNHTWNHADMAKMSATAVRDEIARATDAIHAATGTHPSMFRAPYGAWSPIVLHYCVAHGMTPLDWSVDPRDWARPGVKAIVTDIMQDTRTGSIILEHDGGGNRSETVAALKIVIPRLLDAGYRFRTP